MATAEHDKVFRNTRRSASRLADIRDQVLRWPVRQAAGNCWMTMHHRITVCVCTFRRPAMLERLLVKLQEQQTGGGRLTFNIVVVDNDFAQSARNAIDILATSYGGRLAYYVEAEQSIAKARNLVVSKADGELLAFIDDDEFPDNRWLLTMVEAYEQMGADGILGPVLPHYEFTPPSWIVRGRFHDRPSQPTGAILPWQLTRTGNALLRKTLFTQDEAPFREEFASGGEDRDFFRRMIERGHQFRWCAEAVVYETVPPERCTRSFMLRRALLRGKTPYNQRPLPILKSMLLLPVYGLLLPFTLVRHHWFMKLLVKCFDHLGRILHLFGFTPIKQSYVTE